MLDKILSTLDESVFTDSVKRELYESFEDAVHIKAALMVEEKIQMLEDKSEEHIEVLESKSEEHIEVLESKSEEHINLLEAKSEEYIEFLEAKAEEYVELKEAELLEKLDQYLERIVEEFVEEAKEALEVSVQVSESELIKEAFEAMVESASTEFQTQLSKGADVSIRQEIQELKESYNEAISEVFALKRRNDELMQLGVVAEMCEGLTLLETERFKRLVESVSYTGDERYVERLETIKESIRGLEAQPTQGVKQQVLTEGTRSQRLDEKKDFGNLFSFSHLI